MAEMEVDVAPELYVFLPPTTPSIPLRLFSLE